MNSNRRQFARIPFTAKASLTLKNGEHAVNILDLSLKGALVEPLDPLYVLIGDNGALKVRLDADDIIRMEITIVHHQGKHLGLACREIDIDSITHLRRLVTLNLGDETLTERQIGFLVRQ
ncbi:MAG: PilZ domain-containing protein [Azonexus sp.]|jgi:hypothetical protein|nr:PilZ domain-containing protein [Azonexus sp.]